MKCYWFVGVENKEKTYWIVSHISVGNSIKRVEILSRITESI